MLHLIVNPTAGKVKKLNALERAVSLLQERSINHCISLTEKIGHATTLAAAAVKMGHDVLVLGGDGTIGEAAGGVAGSDKTLYIAPCGTGNDFVKALKLPQDPIEAIKAQLAGKLRKIDIGMMNERVFANVAGTGFDVDVLRATDRFKKRLSGIFPYVMGIVTALGKFKPPKMRITLNGRVFEKPLTILTVANGQYIGGGMLVSPNSKVDDSMFDINWVDGIWKAKMAVLLPTFITGTYGKFKCSHSERSQEIIIEREGMTIELDGELVETDRAHLRLLPQALWMSLPV